MAKIINIQNDIDNDNEQHILQITFSDDVKTIYARNLKLINDTRKELHEITNRLSSCWFGMIVKSQVSFRFQMEEFEPLYDNTIFSFSIRFNHERNYENYQFQLNNGEWKQLPLN